ncbi:unknown [Clostridium sp. CAG:273]|nr:unknown [Clostridium sp. CAG:273]
MENYLWYFTKEWPTIFEIFDKKENSTIRVVGKAKVYDNIVSDYIMNFTQKDECIEKYKLLKALFLLSTSFQNDYSFKTAIGEDGELEFKYNSEVINYENLPEFIKSQAKERTDEIKNIIKEKAKKEALLKKLKKKIDEQNAEYLEKQKQISTFLECKKTFFGKVKYFLNGRKKKEVVSIKRKVNNEEEYEDIQALQKEVVTYEFVEKKVYTIEDIIEIVTRLDSIRKEYKNIELDVKAAELKTENLTRKIKNAKIYIAEINSHKKSIFEFWKFANKDELPGLNEGELDESENDKIGKIFDVDNDMAELGKKIDEIQRVKLSKNEADALFIFRYCSRTMQILNEVKKNSDLTEKQLKEIEKELKQLKKSFKADLKNINLTEFDVFGDILSNEKDNISINNVRHRESKKDKYRILNISKEITLEDFIDNVRNYLKLIKEVLNKIKTNSNLSIYKLSNKKIELENLNIFNINPKNEFKDVDFSKSKEVYLYKVNIKENTPVAFYTNYVFYDNFNKTLPIGMDISTEILFDTFKSKIKETKHEEFNINVYEDEYTSKVLKVNVIEYEGKEYN